MLRIAMMVEVRATCVSKWMLYSVPLAVTYEPNEPPHPAKPAMVV